MKKLSLLVVVALCLITGRASATDFVEPDGVWWDQVPQEARGYVIAGMLGAYGEGWYDGSFHETQRIGNALSSQLQATQSVVRIESKPFDSRAITFRLLSLDEKSLLYDVVYGKKGGAFLSTAAHPIFSKTFGAYATLIDNYYATHPNHHDMHVEAVLGCLADNPADDCKTRLK